jgi:hypothetical protein
MISALDHVEEGRVGAMADTTREQIEAKPTAYRKHEYGAKFNGTLK